VLEDNLYVRCLLNFYKAFVVRRSVLLSKVVSLDIPSLVRNWIIAYLTGCSQTCRTPDGRLSVLQSITRSII